MPGGVVADVEPGCPACHAKLGAGGIILSIDRQAVSTVAGAPDADRAFYGLSAGEPAARPRSVIHRHSLAASVGQGKTYCRTPGKKNPGRRGFFRD